MVYVIVDVSEDFLGSDYEVGHFPYCLSTSLALQITSEGWYVGCLRFQSPWM